jgi:phosphohistidine phosphatase SixA
MLRHGQCCHEGEADAAKALTQHGHQQAEQTAMHLAQLFSSGRLPAKRAMIHSTSRRARETAMKLPSHLPGLEIGRSDVLREADPRENPFRAEEVFKGLFAPPDKGESETLIIVAHNNIILYWLMRVAGVPLERAAQAQCG